MFTTSLRRQSPTLLRLTPLSIRALTSFSSSKSAFVRSRPLKTAILSSSSAQRRFFAISSYLRDEASASAQLADLDPPAGEYAHSGHGHEHHFKNQGPITRFQQLADHKLVNPSLINTITKGLGYDEMTKVQQKTILETLNGENVYVFPCRSLIYFLRNNHFLTEHNNGFLDLLRLKLVLEKQSPSCCHLCNVSSLVKNL